MEFQKHLDFYNKEYWFSTSSDLIPYKNWGNKENAHKYLQKYWLPMEEYQRDWKPIQDKIFIQGNSLPDLLFMPDFKMVALRGGCLFLKEDFEQLQQALRQIGETHFVVIQNSQEFMDGEPMFRMKFPVSITWEELTSGNYISAVLFEMSYNEYFVFGASSNWGKYSANDYENPLDIIGFKPECSTVFKEQFEQSKEEQEEIREWLPPKYKEIIK